MAVITGRAEVRSYINSLPEQLTKVLRGAARAGADVVADEIRDRTPSDAVRENLRIRSKIGEDKIRVTIDVKPGWPRSVATWLEYGTSPHFISVDASQRGGKGMGRLNQQVREAGGDGSLVIGGDFVGDTVFHPGARAQPTFRPALDLKEADAIAAAQSYINARVVGGRIIGTGDAE